MSVRRALVVGGGGALGAAVLEQLLAGGAFRDVGALTGAALQPALRGLQAVADSGSALAAFEPDTALIVFDRQRHANGREAAFVRPQPAELLQRATQLRQAGVTTLIVVMPHAPALLPQALKTGLASLDEGAVAALGFDRLVLMRMAQTGGGTATASSLPQRLADWMLQQLHWMIAPQEQPVRSAIVARVAAALAAALPSAPAGTRVLAPEVLWAAAQGQPVDRVVADWLAGRAPSGTDSSQRW